MRVYIGLFHKVTASGNDFNIPPLANPSVSARIITTHSNGTAERISGEN